MISSQDGSRSHKDGSQSHRDGLGNHGVGEDGSHSDCDGHVVVVIHGVVCVPAIIFLS